MKIESFILYPWIPQNLQFSSARLVKMLQVWSYLSFYTVWQYLVFVVTMAILLVWPRLSHRTSQTASTGIVGLWLGVIGSTQGQGTRSDWYPSKISSWLSENKIIKCHIVIFCVSHAHIALVDNTFLLTKGSLPWVKYRAKLKNPLKWYL